MSQISDQINQEMVRAAKAQDKERLSALRMMRSALQNREIAKRAPLSDEEVMETLSSLLKKGKESIEQFRLGNREDLVQKEEAEYQLILSFLPKQMNDEEIREQLSVIIQEVGASGLKDLGTVMKSAMARFKGRADGKLVQQLARELLSSLGV
jgi:uncharacterized protein YqeY